MSYRIHINKTTIEFGAEVDCINTVCMKMNHYKFVTKVQAAYVWLAILGINAFCVTHSIMIFTCYILIV